MQMNVPCKDCEERKAGCHIACSKYKLFKLFKNAANKRDREERQMKQTCDAIIWRDRIRNH